MKPENYSTLREILSYHVSFFGELRYGDLTNTRLTTLQGSDLEIVSYETTSVVTVEDAQVIEPYDVVAYNAIIHAIDSVLIPSTVQIPPDLVSVLYESGLSPSLVGFLELAGLANELRSTGPYTLFAPSETAFDVIVQETSQGAQVNIDVLKDVLLYHIVPEFITMQELLNGDRTEAITLHGSILRFSVDFDGTVNINSDEATVIELSASAAADLQGRNGIIHLIDSVLIPPITQAPRPTTPTDEPLEDGSTPAPAPSSLGGDPSSPTDESSGAVMNGLQVSRLTVVAFTILHHQNTTVAIPAVSSEGIDCCCC